MFGRAPTARLTRRCSCPPRGSPSTLRGTCSFADAEDNTIKLVTEGEVVTVAGTGEYGFDDGPGPEATFRGPSDVEVDDAGNVYIADSFGDTIRVLGDDGAVTTFAGSDNLRRRRRFGGRGVVSSSRSAWRWAPTALCTSATV